VQVYTGLVYKGPGLPGEINQGLATLLKQNGLVRIADAVGRSHLKIEHSEKAGEESGK